MLCSKPLVSINSWWDSRVSTTPSGTGIPVWASRFNSPTRPLSRPYSASPTGLDEPVSRDVRITPQSLHLQSCPSVPQIPHEPGSGLKTVHLEQTASPPDASSQTVL